MNEQDLKSLLRRQPRELPGRTTFCPADQVLAVWFDGELAEQEQSVIRQHLVHCDYCIAHIGMLARLKRDSSACEVDGEWLAAARQMGQKRSSGNRWAWATAALVLLAVSVIITGGIRSTGAPPGAIQNEAEARQVRSTDANALTPRLLAPVPGDSVDPGALTIRWTRVPGSLYYELFVMSDKGDMVLEKRVEGSEWTGRTDVELQPEAEYYVRVEARMADARSLSSGHVLFRVAGKAGGAN